MKPIILVAATIAIAPWLAGCSGNQADPLDAPSEMVAGNQAVDIAHVPAWKITMIRSASVLRRMRWILLV